MFNVDQQDMTKLIDELDALSEEEARRLVGEERNESSDR